MTDDSKKKKTLGDEDMTTDRKVSRRSMFSVLGVGVGIGAAGATATALSGCIVHTNEPTRGGGHMASGITDGDAGNCADPGGHGWGNTGITDGDSGNCADPASRGRQTGLTDSDGGSYADAGGRGRRGS